MKVSITFAFAALAATVVEANMGQDTSLAARHARIGRRADAAPSPKRCKARPHAPKKDEAPVKIAAAVEEAPVEEKKPEKQEPAPQPPKEDKPKEQPKEDKPKEDKPKEEKPKEEKPKEEKPQPQGNSGGVLNVSGNCGNAGASGRTTSDNGPNGRLDWLNCGVNEGGWNPPYIKVDQLVTVDLGKAMQSGDSPFHACAAFVDKFYKYGGEFGIPAIMLASFAMQESSCNPQTTGGGGECGLMQITSDKWGGAPGGNCYDPDFNIRTGAKFFAQTLKNNGGDVLKSIGMYNGWSAGMTYNKATAMAKSSCCRCQNNLDYLHQFVNGWLQNINAYSHTNRLGKYFNLDVC